MLSDLLRQVLWWDLLCGDHLTEPRGGVLVFDGLVARTAEAGLLWSEWCLRQRHALL